MSEEGFVRRAFKTRLRGLAVPLNSHSLIPFKIAYTPTTDRLKEDQLFRGWGRGGGGVGVGVGGGGGEARALKRVEHHNPL